jgi:hypothetical protein
MAYKKTVTFELKCEGVCGGPPINSNRIPPDWSRVLVKKASVPNGIDATMYRMLLCPECTSKAVFLLQSEGFVLTALTNKPEKAGKP